MSGNWDEINKSVYGSPTADNSATEGLLVYTGDDAAHAPNGVKAMVIKGASKWQITFDANNLTYSVSRKYDDLFLTGSEYNWGKTASDWKQLTPVNGSDTDFWTIIYLHENEEFKFAPQAAWEGGDFGFIGAEKIHDEAGVGIVDAGGNLKVTNAGWYLIHVTMVIPKRLSLPSRKFMCLVLPQEVNGISIVPLNVAFQLLKREILKHQRCLLMRMMKTMDFASV